VLFDGRLLHQRYRLDAHIASGGMGEVWRGTDLVLGRTVAVKALSAALAGDPGFGRRFLAEAQTMGALRHPGIIEVYDYGEESGPDGERLVYLVMEYVPGRTLAQWLSDDGRLTVTQTMAVLAAAADALHAVHQAGIVHRDVKPSNLLVDEDGRVRLADFGVARTLATEGFTAAGDVVGTAFYMAPEQASGHPVTPAADVYALGAIGYHCLAGEPVFLGASPLEVALQHVQSTPRPLPADVSRPAAALVLRALAKAPGDRFPSAAALAGAARAVQAGASQAATGQAAAVAATAVQNGDAWHARAAVPARAAHTEITTMPVYDPPGRAPGKTAMIAVLVLALLMIGGLALAWGLSQLDDGQVPPTEGPSASLAPGQSTGPTAPTARPSAAATASPTGPVEASEPAPTSAAPEPSVPAPSAEPSAAASPPAASQPAATQPAATP
jgi:serine/threonine-protein kinase